LLEGLADEFFAFFPQRLGATSVERISADTFADGSDDGVVGNDFANMAVFALLAADFVAGAKLGFKAVSGVAKGRGHYTGIGDDDIEGLAFCQEVVGGLCVRF